MASKDRKRIRAAKRIATVSVAAASATALMVGATPLPPANAVSTQGSTGLPSMALAPGAPDPASIPDLTFGLGSQAYNAFQTGGAALESALLDNVNLSGVLQRLGVDPTMAINTALGTALTQVLTGVTVPVESIPVLGAILKSAGITNVAALLNLLGFNIADPFNLSGAATPGINIITAGPPFSLLKFLGIDLGWVPGFPNSVASDINGTPYLGISAVNVLETLKNAPGVTALEKATLDTLIGTVKTVIGDGSAIDVRVPVVLGFGLGAFAAGMAYPQVVGQLANQPGGADFTGTSPLAGSLTILPMVLLRNPGRANGGLFARFYPEAGLFGVDTVTPDTAVASSDKAGGLSIPVGSTGIVIGGANIIPIKVDATVEYDPLSDVPAWPNPVSLANSAAAALFPTYLLRGITAESLTELVDGQLKPQLAAATGNTGGPLALNLYLTVPVNGALPLLEPIKLPVDAINLLTGANLNNPIAAALEPALTSLVNLGYTDVKRNIVNGVPEYDRTLDQGNVITPFGSLPSGVNWGQVPVDLFLQLVAGVQQAIAQGFVGSGPVANPLAALANLLGLNALPGAASTDSATDAAAKLPELAVNTASAAVATPQQQSIAAPSQSSDVHDNKTPVAAEPDAATEATDIDAGADDDTAPVDGTPAAPTDSSNPGTKLLGGIDNSIAKTAEGFGNVVKGVGETVQKTLNSVSGKQNQTSADKPSEGSSDQGGGDSGD
jgi:hypothetical protein